MIGNNKIFDAVNIMIQTNRMHRHLIDSMVSEVGIHRTHHRILMHIALNDKLDSQKSLAEHIGVTPAAITVALKKLECDGYIKRVQGSDNRFNEIVITDLGKKVVEETKALFSEIDMSLFKGFSEEELDGYIAYHKKIQSNIKNNLHSSSEGRCKNNNEKMG